jgi:hypothetical protein
MDIERGRLRYGDWKGRQSEMENRETRRQMGVQRYIETQN